VLCARRKGVTGQKLARPDSPETTGGQSGLKNVSM
jgi:hypothetical protein